MFIFRKDKKMQKNSTKMSGKRGFTLVELSVVLALVAIVTVMIVSFSIMMDKFAVSAQAEYDFLEDSNILKNQIIEQISVYDVDGYNFSVVDGSELLLTKDDDDEFSKNLDFSDDNFNTSFEVNDKLIKCTIKSTSDDVYYNNTFVVALRCANHQ